jgi:hypothetical protein
MWNRNVHTGRVKDVINLGQSQASSLADAQCDNVGVGLDSFEASWCNSTADLLGNSDLISGSSLELILEFADSGRGKDQILLDLTANDGSGYIKGALNLNFI